jgi:SAM-dependent methyltransferase
MGYEEQAGLWIRHARSNSSFYQYLERPAMRSMLPDDLTGQSILCLGVGSGEEIGIYEGLGAARITGVDNAPSLLKVARERYPAYQFKLMDLNDLHLEQEYDLVVSSMALHYVADWPSLLTKVSAALKPGGMFVFSTHNPVWWSAEKTTTQNGYVWAVGVEQNNQDHARKPLGRYLESGEMQGEVIKGLTTSFYNRPFSQMIQEMTDSPFLLRKVIEPRPIEAAATDDPSFYRVTNRIPPIVVFQLTKPA